MIFSYSIFLSQVLLICFQCAYSQLNNPVSITAIDGTNTVIKCKIPEGAAVDTIWLRGNHNNDSVSILNLQEPHGKYQIVDRGDLLISSVNTEKDEGVYTCSRNTSTGVISASAILDVLGKTQIIEAPSDAKIILSSTARFRCGISRDPRVLVEVQWSFNGKTIKKESSNRVKILPDNTLVVEQARNTDVGVYTCTAVSVAGNEKRSARLDVIELPYPPANVKAELNANGVNVSWSPRFNGNSPIIKYIVYLRVFASPHEVDESAHDHSHGWTAAVVNISGSDNFVLVTNLRPTMTYQFRVSAVNFVGEGQPSTPPYPPVTLPAKPPSAPPLGVVGVARSSMAITVQWQPPAHDAHNGQILGYIVRYKLAGYSETPWYSINITNNAQLSITLDDLIVWQNYEIQVAAYYAIGVGSYSPSIYVRTKEVINNPTNITAIDGSNTVIKCKTPEGAALDTIWLRSNHINDSFSILNVQESLGKYQIVDGGDLLISSVNTEKDEGVYTCSRNTSSGIISASAILEVLGKTKIIEAPSDAKIILSSTARFRCGISRDPRVLVEVQWSFNGKTIKKESSNRVKILPDNTLVVEQARNTDAGVYTCTTVSEAGNEKRSAKLDVIELPYPPANVKAELNVNGVNVSWSPPFDGNSPIIKYIVYMRVFASPHGIDENAHDISHGWTAAVGNVSGSDNFVLVTNLRPAMTHEFRVSAVNVVGEGQPSAPSYPPVTLPAQPPSAPPFGVVGAARSSMAITVQWQPPTHDSHNGQLLGYIVRYKLAGYSETPWYSINITNNAQLSVILDDLIVWQNYEIQVGAYNAKGVGSYSPSIYVRTKEGIPAAGPRHVSVKSLNSSAVQVSWYSPDPQLINGINQGYKLRAYLGSILFKETIVAPHPLPETAHVIVMSGLEPYTKYRITVVCFTSAGDGPENEPPTEITTHQDRPLEVGDFRFSNILDTSLEVEWSPPKQTNGELLCYTLTYYIVGTPEDQWHIRNYSAHLNLANIEGLEPQTDYTFEIYAWTVVGSGPSKTSTIKTSMAPVGPLRFSNITMTSLKVSWDPPVKPNGALTGYYITYETLIRDFSKQVKQKINENFLLVTGLREVVTYTFKVRAETAIGVGPERVGNITTGPQPGSPPPPVLFTVTQSLTSVTLKWKNPDFNGILGYLIEAKQPKETEWQPVETLLNGPQERHDLSFTHLAPSARYNFRIMTINENGISVPVTSDVSSVITAPSQFHLRAKLPFYFENWFVTTVACLMIVFTILFIATLCVYNTNYKYKQEVKKVRSHDALSEVEYDNMENPYSSGFELRHNSVSSNYHQRSHGALNSAIPMAATKSPPRPSPGSITYSDDEEDDDDETKDANLYGSSGDSVTEKPSEFSSSGPESESERDDDLAAASHFVNHYANVTDTLRKGQSWKKHAHSYVVKPPSSNHSNGMVAGASAAAPPSYNMAVAVTASDDSELDCLSVNLNGGRIIVNNAVGSRAGVIPGFSSFV